MKRVLLTGGTGFIGANLVRRLLRDGHEVHLVVRPGFAVWRIENIRANLCLHSAELTDAQQVNSIVANVKPEWVFHLAAYGSSSWQRETRLIVDANVTGTVTLLDACVREGFASFVNTGTSSEYGLKDHAPSEYEALEPASCYAVTKTCATHYCTYVGRSVGLPVRTLRLYSVFGPYESPRRLLPALIIKGLQGTLPSLVSPDVAHDYVYIDDVLDAYILAATSPNQEPGAVYNVGSGTQTTLREVIATARRQLGIEVEPQWGSMPNRHWDTACWIANVRLICATLGWRPRTVFDDGFRVMTEWFIQNPEMAEQYRAMMAQS